MPTFDEVAAFVREQTGSRGPLTAATVLQSGLGVHGDDMDDLLAAYAKRFGVDLSGYLWYFHTGEEGFNVGGLFFPPPNALVPTIPITLGMLHEFAALGRWTVEYPQQDPPQPRGDLRLNQLLVVGFMGVVLVVIVRGCVS